jgi:MATE family multidrug resistance protein
MKKGLIASYVSGLTDVVHGESYATIIRYFIPEFITAFLLYSMPLWIDAYFIGQLKSTPVYGTLGATNNLIHLIIKIAEAFSVGTLVLSGKQNGRGEFKSVGRTLRDAFWITCIVGLSIAGFLYVAADWIYSWYVPSEMVAIGAPFLRLRAISIFFMFIVLAFVGFLRGIKNTRVPMYIFVSGIITFLCLDYLLIFGVGIFPRMGLHGSAVASLVQYVVMLIVAVTVILKNKTYRRYGIELFSSVHQPAMWKDLCSLSFPILLDKSILALAYIWLCAMMKPMGTASVATFCVIRDMERCALVPAIACAQVVTFLVSNGIGVGNWDGIKSTIKKIVFLATIMVFMILMLFCLYPVSIIQCFDPNSEFTSMAARAFPILSMLAFFDTLQLILAGALRGAANVQTVMSVRFAVCLFYFMPVSYLIAYWLPIDDMTMRFILVYGSFYLGNGLMSVMYINRFRSEEWKMPQIL